MKKSFLNQMAAVRRWQTSAIGAFSLTELLVVLAIMAVLASVFLSASFTTRERVLRAECVSNLRQIGTGWSMYQNDFNQMMPCHWPGYASSGGTTNPWRTYEVGRVVPGTVGWANIGDGPQGPWNLGMLFANGLVPNLRVFYCPATTRIDNRFVYSYYTAVSNTWPSTSLSSGDPEIRTGYNYFPQGRKLMPNVVPVAGYGTAGHVSPLQQNDIDPNKSIATDLVNYIEDWSHLASGSVAGLNALFPDGRVVFQNARSNPQAFDPALWLHSNDPNNYIGDNPANFRFAMSLWHP